MNPERVPELIEALKPYVSLVCEAQVLDFSTRAQYGPWLKLRVAEGELLTGLETGQRFHVIMVHIGDTEMPAALEGKERKPYRLSQLAGAMCVDPQFWQWIKHVYGDDIQDKDGAAKWVREACAVSSRSHLDDDHVAAEMFRDIMRDFDSWKQAAG